MFPSRLWQTNGKLSQTLPPSHAVYVWRKCQQMFFKNKYMSTSKVSRYSAIQLFLKSKKVIGKLELGFLAGKHLSGKDGKTEMLFNLKSFLFFLQIRSHLCASCGFRLL